MSKVFISFDFNDAAAKATVINWRKQGLGTDISFTTKDGNNYLSRGRAFVDAILREKINECDKVLVLVGDNTHNGHWIDLEVNHPINNGKKILWTQISGSRCAPTKSLEFYCSVPFNLIDIQFALRA